MKWTSLLSLVALTAITGCGTLDRSYIAQMEQDDSRFFMAGRDFPVMSGDTGNPYRTKEEIKKRTPASVREQKAQKEELSLKQELAQKEESMSEFEMAEYARDSKYLPSESDKLYYLSLSDSEKAVYIQTKKDEYNQDHGAGKDLAKERSIHAPEIYLGMSKDEVIQKWGRPTRIQIAGNPKYQNELWLFSEDGSYRQVFFESGRVNGWALDL